MPKKLTAIVITTLLAVFFVGILLSNTVAPKSPLAPAQLKPLPLLKISQPRPRGKSALLLVSKGATSSQVQGPVIGLSIEYGTMVSELGPGPCPPASFVNELLKLGSPPIRLGGISQEITAPSNAQIPPGLPLVIKRLPATFWSQLHCLLTQTHDPLTVGINVRTGTNTWAVQMALAAAGAATNGLSFAIGNEPDDYHTYLNGAELVHGNLSPAQYLQRALPIISAMQKALPAPLSLVGPDLANAIHWKGQFSQVIQTLHLTTADLHLKTALPVGNKPLSLTSYL